MFDGKSVLCLISVCLRCGVSLFCLYGPVLCSARVVHYVCFDWCVFGSFFQFCGWIVLLVLIPFVAFFCYVQVAVKCAGQFVVFGFQTHCGICPFQLFCCGCLVTT